MLDLTQARRFANRYNLASSLPSFEYVMATRRSPPVSPMPFPEGPLCTPAGDVLAVYKQRFRHETPRQPEMAVSLLTLISF